MLQKLHTLLLSVRQVFHQQIAFNSYKPWPAKKYRRIGRSPPNWIGQGGRRGRKAYDKRYPISGKDVNATTEGLTRGGNKYMPQMIGEGRASSNPAVLKYYDYEKEREVTEIIPEMIPEFIVPDLTNFKLKPYVSYSVPETKFNDGPLTASKLYQQTYLKSQLKKKKS